MKKINFLLLLVLVLVLVTEQCLADFKIADDKITVFDETIAIFSSEKLLNIRVFNFKVNENILLGVYQCDTNIIAISVPKTKYGSVFITPPHSFGRTLGDYVCSYSGYKLSEEVY